MTANNDGSARWDDPTECPFCGASLADGGPAFIDHLPDTGGCRREFDTWRNRITEDIRGEWSG